MFICINIIVVATNREIFWARKKREIFIICLNLKLLSSMDISGKIGKYWYGQKFWAQWVLKTAEWAELISLSYYHYFPMVWEGGGEWERGFKPSGPELGGKGNAWPQAEMRLSVVKGGKTEGQARGWLLCVAFKFLDNWLLLQYYKY